MADNFLCALDISSRLVAVGFINPESLGDRLPRQGSTQESKKQQGKGTAQQLTGRSGPRRATPACQLLRPTYLIGALAPGSSRLRTASPIGRPAPSPTSDSDPRVSSIGVRENTTSYSDPASPTGDPVGSLFTALLRLTRLGPTGAIRPGTPARKGPAANREGSAQSQTTIPGPYPVRLWEQCSTTAPTQTVLWAPLDSHTAKSPPHAFRHR